MIRLNLLGNKNVVNINHLKSLQKLNASFCTIADKGICELNLFELDVTCNKSITDISHMTNLKILRAEYKRSQSYVEIKNTKCK